MRVAIIDADLVYRDKHRFPNLACMKISAYYKRLGDDVELKFDYEDLESYDLVFISKVFIDTELPFEPLDKTLKNESTVAMYYKSHPILNLPNVRYGGTGFFYDKAPKLDDEIEHIMPDYDLYSEWVKSQIKSGNYSKLDLKYYTDFSIGFTTRGCIRQCKFCVNKNFKECKIHSNIEEFLDPNRKYICLLDDNVLSCKNWKQIFDELIATGKPFQFKQGMDERLLTDEKCEYIFNKSKWIGDRIFAFDNIKDKDLIQNKLMLIRKHTDKRCKFYVFTAFNHGNPGVYDNEFYRKDFESLFERIKILITHSCLPYIMRYKDYETSKYSDVYTQIARWCNQDFI